MKRVLFLIISMFIIYMNFQKEPIQVEKEYVVKCVRSDGIIEKINLEEYVVGVVSAEMPASFDLEALKAQAVASRTFVLSRNLNVDDTTSSQVYLDQNQRKEKWQDQYDIYETKIKEAVYQTKGEVLTYNNQYISALFFSSSDGYTENNEDYFETSELPYLRSVASVYETPVVAYKIVNEDTLFQLFDASEIKIISYTKGGNVKEAQIGNTIYTGREIREKLGLNSSNFEVKRVDEGYAFTTYGYGHGVGMSQYGANGMAKEGYSYEEILKHYYQDVCIKNLE